MSFIPHRSFDFGLVYNSDHLEGIGFFITHTTCTIQGVGSDQMCKKTVTFLYPQPLGCEEERGSKSQVVNDNFYVVKHFGLIQRVSIFYKRADSQTNDRQILSSSKNLNNTTHSNDAWHRVQKCKVSAVPPDSILINFDHVFHSLLSIIFHCFFA